MQRSLVPEIDRSSLQYAIAGGSYARGVEYLRQGRVAGMWWDESRRALEGQVRGRDGGFYATTAYFSPGAGRAIEFEHGECSCPMVLDCKHVVALTLAAAERADRATATAVPAAKPAAAAVPAAPAAPAWEQSLRSLLPQGPATVRLQGQPAATALAIELTLDQHRRRSCGPGRCGQARTAAGSRAT